LKSLATILADWVDAAPGIPVVYLFGSRVRGDHRSDSDVDVRLYVDRWSADSETTRWWTEQNNSDFAALKAKLPGPLAIHREKVDEADAAVMAGAENPMLVVRKVVCVWIPPKPNS
jgi:predicted nucleotidyltransferase